jgi:hypothetical protein
VNQYEYRVVKYYPQIQNIAAGLNEEGRQGYMLVASMNVESDGPGGPVFTLVFMRELPEG